ncbi:MAG: dihydrofolate reductase family protein [Planctomycetota bacterium]
MANTVFIATSLDGFISDKEDRLDWQHAIPNPNGLDFGHGELINRIDAIVMGRKTFETVCGFDGPWPYSKPVFVWSRTLSTLPEPMEGDVRLISGTPAAIQTKLLLEGHQNLYIDGGTTIQSFLTEDLVDEMIITVLPVLLGGGSRLFGQLAERLNFVHIKTEVMLNAMVQSHYQRRR